MTKIGIVRYGYPLEFDLESDFTFDRMHVYTVSGKESKKLFPQSDYILNEHLGVKTHESNEEECQFGYLIIEATFELERYDSWLQGSAKIRPQLLVVHGILTFLTGKVFISFQSSKIIFNEVERHIESNTLSKVLKVNGTNYLADLKKIITAILNSDQKRKILIFTLFERWRKALHFEEESEENFLYIDESVLAYIHILEVLSDEYKKELEVEIKSKRNDLITQILDCANKENKDLKRLSSLLNLLNTNQVTLKSKVIRMLKELKLYNLKSEAILLRFIDHRNAIAHGRKNLYQDKVVFPLKPFFSFIKDIDENLETIKIFSAKTISAYLNLDAFDEDWDLLMLAEPVPITSVKDFLDNKKIRDIPVEEFINGSVEGITPDTLAFYCSKNQIKINVLENALSEVFISAKINKRNFQLLFNSAILLSDSKNFKLANKAREIIKKVHHNGWMPYLNIRDIIKQHEYYGINLEWLGQWLVSKKENQSGW